MKKLEEIIYNPIVMDATLFSFGKFVVISLDFVSGESAQICADNIEEAVELAYIKYIEICNLDKN